MRSKLFHLFTAAAVLFGLFSFGDLTPVQRSFLRERTRVVSQDTKTLPGYCISVMAKGRETWTETNKLSVVNFKRAPRKISKLRLIVNLKKIGKWDAVKMFIKENDLEDEFNAAQFISEDYPGFDGIINLAVRSGLGTRAEIEEIINNSVDK